MPHFAWYLKRLRVMSGREILHRLGQQLAVFALLARYRMGMLPPGQSTVRSDRLRFCMAGEAQVPSPAFDIPALRQAAPGLLAGEIPVCGRPWRWKHEPEIWHRAPDTGRLWPKRFFAGIAYRDGNPNGDVRQLWEPARLQQLVDLAVIARIGTADDRRRALRMVCTQLQSWVEDNPPLTGAHYISAMECALRLIAVCHSLDMIRDQIPDRPTWNALAVMVSTHAPLIAQRLSLHSATGNHTIAEAAGLVYAGVLFPELNGARQWLSTGHAILERESQRQVLPDGGGAEQALSYHLFNIQLLSLVRALLDHHGRTVSPTITDAVDQGWRFLSAMGLSEGRLPLIGDSDDGHALSRHSAFAECAADPVPNARTFGHTGCTVARIASSPPLRLLFDHGPLGMPPAYGHGHADALSVVLAAGDEDILVDTGTYTYTGDQHWRRFFRGTGAHNTVTVDGQDQATQEACFLWSRPYRARLIASETGDAGHGRLLADHDGYRHMSVRHVRGVAWLHDRWLLIWDGLFGNGRHQLDLNWHLARPPTWRDERVFELAATGETLEIRCEGGDLTAHRGEHDPIIGWRSRSYGTREPITTVRLSYYGSLPHSFLTLIRLPGGNRSEGALQDDLTWMTEQSREGRNASTSLESR